MTPSAAGKGDDNRVSDYKKYRENFDLIFGKKEIICPKCGDVGIEETTEYEESFNLRAFVCPCCNKVWTIDL